MPNPHCLASVRLERIRLAKLNPTTRAPLVGANNGYVSDAQVLLRVGVEIETGRDVTQKNGGGRVCASFKESDTFKRATVQLQVCQADPVLESFLTGGGTFADGSNIQGVQAPRAGATLENYVALEGWTRAWDGTTQAVPPSTSPDVAYWHWVFPMTSGWVPNDFDLGDGVHLFQFNGIAEENTAFTLNGAFNDFPAYIADEGGVVAAYGRFLDDQIPAATCARIPIPSGS